MKLSDLTRSGHWPTLLAAFLYFDYSFMVWTVLGPLGVQIGESLGLSPEQKGLMVAGPILSWAILRILLGLLVDCVGAAFRFALLCRNDRDGYGPRVCGCKFCGRLASGRPMVSSEYARGSHGP